MDRYKQNLKRAAWDWLEGSGHKDRVDGRSEKRSARQADQREIELDTDLPRNLPCEECGEYECPGARK